MGVLWSRFVPEDQAKLQLEAMQQAERVKEDEQQMQQAEKIEQIQQLKYTQDWLASVAAMTTKAYGDVVFKLAEINNDLGQKYLQDLNTLSVRIKLANTIQQLRALKQEQDDLKSKMRYWSVLSDILATQMKTLLETP